MTLSTTLRRLGAILLCSLAASQAPAATFAAGADVSWVSQLESAGYGFYDASARRQDPFALLKGKGIDAVRLRVWVSPSGGWCDGADTLYKARRAKAQGQRILIDFHYSDSWADPGQQKKPAAWASHGASQLYTDVYDHTRGILSYLKQNGITVDWVQVGNEINGGMLWPEGSTANFLQLTYLINSGYNAVKSIYPQALVIVHLANGYKDADFRSFFDRLKSNGGSYDVIGLSHYPSPSDWKTKNAQIGSTMSDMVARYGKPVMVTEVGMDWTQAATSRQMVADLITRVKGLGSSKGLGVFYWEPEDYPGWQGYTLGALNNSGQFTEALDAF